MRNDHNTFVTVRLSRAEAKHVARLIRGRVRKAERQYDHDFVPEPGRRHAAQNAIDMGLALLAKFEEALDLEVQVWEDEVWVDDPDTHDVIPPAV